MASALPENLSVGMLLDGKLCKDEGVPRYAEDIGSYMTREGHRVTYCVGSSDRSGEDIITLGRTADWGTNGNRVEAALFISSRQAQEIVDRVNPDVLHLQMVHNPLATGRIIHHASPDVPVVATFHVLPNSRTTSFAMHAFARATRKANERFRMIGNSKATQQFLHRVFGLDSVLIPNPVDLSKFQVGRRLEEYNDGKINVVFLGRLVERKGVQYLVEAVGGLDEKTKARVRLLIAGTGELAPKIQAQLSRLGLEANTKLLGYVSDEDKPHLLASADLAVFPATGGESFGIVLAEAMAARAGVVIGGNNPGYSSVLEKTPETLVNPRDIAVFRDKLKWLIEHEEERAKLNAIQQDVVEAFDIREVGKAIEELYRDSLSA